METKISRSELIQAIIFRVLIMITFLVLIIFIPAGSFSFWQGWAYLAVILIPFAFAVSYFLDRDPAFLERRMRMREKEKTQAKIQGFGLLYYLSVFIFPGLDYRWNWSSVPVWVVILADILVLAGYFIIVRVFKENSLLPALLKLIPNKK